MKKFDPEQYTISVRKEVVEGELLFVARVAELPDIQEFADCHTDAYAFAIETIRTAYDLCLENEIPFPEPLIISDESLDASGRVTLRMPKSLHAQLIRTADKEGVSLNQYIVSALSVQYGQCKASESLMREFKESMIGLSKEITSFHRTAVTYIFKDYIQIASKQEDNWVPA